jgi:hypothetical protein
LKPALFTSSHFWTPARVGALAIYCSDGRWGEAFDEFCHESLGIPRYDRFAVPGGPAWLTLRDVSTIRPYEAVREHLEFLVTVHELQRIVLITHYGCAFYQRMLGRSAEGCLPAQEDDLRKAAAVLRVRFLGIEVEGYTAMQREGSISFHGVDL